MARAGSATGSSAQRQADQALTARLTRYQQRQKQLRGPVAAYFRALAAIERTRTEAERKAQRLRTETDKKIAQLGEQTDRAVAEHQQVAEAAIAELAGLGEHPREIAELLGITPALVRAAIAGNTAASVSRRASRTRPSAKPDAEPAAGT